MAILIIFLKIALVVAIGVILALCSDKWVAPRVGADIGFWIKVVIFIICAIPVIQLAWSLVGAVG